VRRVIDLARIGTFEGMRILSELRQAGAIRAVVAQDAAPLARPAAIGLLAVRRAAAALVPLAALAAVAASVAVPPPASDQRIARATFASLREDYAMRAVRNALEAYRLAHGSWPARLEELSDAGLIAPETLATVSGRAYYSMDRDHGPIFLAPDPSPDGS
jgi:hypothetical protein